MPASSKYAIRLMQEDDREAVSCLLKKSFYPDEPISRCIQINECADLFSSIVINTCLPHRCSFLAYDTESNQIVAVCLNEIIQKDACEEMVVSNEKISFIFQILHDIDRKVKMFEKLNTDNLLHVYVMSVDRTARGHDLASRLISKSMEHVAQQFKINGAYAEATNVYSLNCFKKQQFNIYDDLIYANYDPKRLADLTDPMYDRCYLVGRNF